MTTPTIIHKYQNGNCLVTLCLDGTKIREWPDNEEPVAEYPESIDIKCTNKCDGGCTWCHERSTIHGIHAKVDDIMCLVDGLPPGVEMAIGGGNPLDHPQLPLILTEFRNRGFISNLTVLSDHYYRQYDLLKSLYDRNLYYGLGISCQDGYMSSSIYEPFSTNMIIHVIAGIASPMNLIRGNKYKYLVLGYKKYGFGEKYYNEKIQNNTNCWKYWIQTIMTKCEGVSFDNLAIEQLGIKDKIPPELWKTHYMGDDEVEYEEDQFEI